MSKPISDLPIEADILIHSAGKDDVASRSPLPFLCLAFFLTFLGAGAFQQYVKPVHAQLHLTAQEAAWVLASVYLSFLVWRVFCPFTLYLLGDNWSIFLGSLTYAGFTMVALLIPCFVSLLAAAIVWGWGAAALWIASSTLVLDRGTRSRYGTASGLFYAATHAGQGLGVLLLGWLLGGSVAIPRAGVAATDIRPALFVATLLSGVAAVVAFFLPRHSCRREQPRLIRIFGVLLSVKSKLLAFALFVSSLGFGILLNGLGSEIEAHFGVCEVGILTQGFYVMRLVASFFGGWISDRIGRHRVLVFVLIFTSLALIVVGWHATRWSYLLAAAALGTQVGIVPVTAMAMIGDSTSPARRHLVFGALYAWRDLGVVLAVLGGEYLTRLSGTWQAAFLVFAAIFFLCGLLSTRLKHLAEAPL